MKTAMQELQEKITALINDSKGDETRTSAEDAKVENNGWIKIESEDNIPKHFGYYWIKLSVDALDEIVCYNAVHKEGFAGVDNQFYAYNIIGYYAPIKKPKF